MSLRSPGALSLPLVSNSNMTFRKWAVRVVRWAGMVAFSLVLLAFLTVQFQQIRLYQSTWADAQRLMHAGERGGHYDGSCTAQSCKYEIENGQHRPLYAPCSASCLAGLASHARPVQSLSMVWRTRLSVSCLLYCSRRDHLEGEHLDWRQCSQEEDAKGYRCRQDSRFR